MQAENAPGTRRFTLLDAIIMIAAAAVGIFTVADVWPEVNPLLQKLEITRLVQPDYIKDELFSTEPPSVRIGPISFRRNSRRRLSTRDATVRNQMAQMVGPAMGLMGWRDTVLDWKTRKPSHERWLDNWVQAHAPPGQLGFALAQDAFWLLFPSLLIASFCLICLRLIPPRPSWATLFRQPGWWACLGSILGAMLGHADRFFFVNPAPSVVVPAMVAVVWVVLAVSRMWRAERSWIDRAGRLLGLLWLATIPIYLVGFVFS